MIKAITFDFWDTIVVDDSDEETRSQFGLPTKVQARIQLLADEILNYHPDIPIGKIRSAFDHANENFRYFWKERHVTPSVADRYRHTYEFLKIDLTPTYADLVRAVEEMEVLISPRLIDGVSDAIRELAKNYRIAIISDTIHTPGHGLRQILEKHDLLHYFEAFVFSDEICASKPNPITYQKIATDFNITTKEILHIGDREETDIDGAIGVDAKSILFVGAIDRGSDRTRASAVCKNYADLPNLVRKLDQ